MKKNIVLKISNLILLVLFVNQTVTALFHEKLSHEAFEVIHEGAGVILVGLVVVHLILNFSWVKASYFPK